MGVPQVGAEGVRPLPTGPQKKELDVTALTKSAETLLTNLESPEGVAALKALIDGGYFKEAGTIMGKIMKLKIFLAGTVTPENNDRLDAFFTKVFMPNADASETVDISKLFQVLRHCPRQKSLLTYIRGWLNGIGKQNASEIIVGKMQYAGLFEKVKADDENGDGVINTNEAGYANIKEMDQDGNGVSVDEMALYAIAHRNIQYSKELIDSLLHNIKTSPNKEKYLSLLQSLAKTDLYAKLTLANYYFDQGKFREGIILLHEYVTLNPQVDTDIIEDYQIFLSALGLKEDLSNIDGPNNIQFLEDLAYYYTNFAAPGKSPLGFIRSMYADPPLTPITMYNIDGLKDAVKRCAEILSENPQNEKIARLKTKLEEYIKEYQTTKGAGQIRLVSNGNPVEGNLTITNLEQTLTIYLPTEWATTIDLSCNRYRLKDSIFQDYMYSRAEAVPIESGNPLMVKVEIPAWKFLKLISPGEEEVKISIEFQNDQDQTRTVSFNIKIPPEIWGTGSKKQPDATQLYQRMMGDVLHHYQDGASGPAVLEGSFVINAHKDHPERDGLDFAQDRFFDPRMASSPLYALQADGFKCVKVLKETPAKKPEELPKPDTALPDTSYTIDKEGHIVQKWGYPLAGDELVVVSPREIRIYEKRIFPKDMQGALKAEYDKLPKEVQERIAKEGIVIRISVPFYTDTYAGTTFYHQQLLDDNQFFIAVQTHLPFSQSYIPESLMSAPGYKPRSKPGMMVAIHCDSGATTTPIANAYGNLITTSGPRDKTYGNPFPAIFVLRGIVAGQSNEGLDSAAIQGQAYAQKSTPGKVKGVWGKSGKATGGHMKDIDADGLPDVLDPNPTTQNVYYYDRVHSRLVIYNPVTNKEIVLKDFRAPRNWKGQNYSGFEPLSFNGHVINRSETTFIAYVAKKTQTRFAYLQSQETQAAKPTK